MIVAVHQPQYLPWLGYFEKIMTADAFCYLDNVQYKKNEWQNRNRIKTVDGWQWLTVPVSYRFPQKINDVMVNNLVNWKKKHRQALQTNYRRAPFFEEYFPIFEELYARDWELISDLNIYLIEKLRVVLNLHHKPAVVASNLDLRDDPSDRLIDICRFFGADTYLSGQDGANYMDLDRFKQCGIRVMFQDFQHPEYPQLFKGFQSHLSIIDLLFNCGPESVDIIRSGFKIPSNT